MKIAIDFKLLAELLELSEFTAFTLEAILLGKDEEERSSFIEAYIEYLILSTQNGVNVEE